MKAQQRLPGDLSRHIHSAVSSALWGNLKRAVRLSGSIDHDLAALDPLSAPSLCAEIAQVLGSAHVLHQREKQALAQGVYPLSRLWFAIVARLGGQRSLRARSIRSRALPSTLPELAPVLSCDPDGHVREAAIRAWVPPARSRFHLAMFVVRTNDWVLEVRHAALERLPEFWNAATAVDRICLSLLMLDPVRMGRIGEDRRILEALTAAPAARQEILEDLKQIDGRHSVRLFSLVLRQPWIDPHLASLAREAKAPLVRARALNALTTGRVKWRTGLRQVWQGGTWGFMRSVREYAQRMVHSDADPADAVVAALTDRCTAVRRVAVEALGDRPEAFQDAATLALTLLDDRSRSVVERAAFAVRRSGPEGERALADRIAAGKDRHGAIRAVLDRGAMLKGD